MNMKLLKTGLAAMCCAVLSTNVTAENNPYWENPGNDR